MTQQICEHGTDITPVVTSGWQGDIWSHKITQPICPQCRNSLVAEVTKRFAKAVVTPTRGEP